MSAFPSTAWPWNTSPSSAHRHPSARAWLGGLVLPVLGDLASLDRRFFVLAFVLPGGLDDGRMDDLSALGQIAGSREMYVETGEEIVDGTGPNKVFAEQPDRLGIRHLLGQGQAQEPYK